MSFRYAEFKVKCFRSISNSFILWIPQHRSACMFTSVLNHNSYEMLQVSPPSQQNTDTSLSFWFESFARELENAGKQECLSSALNTNVIRPGGCESFPAGCPHHLSHFTNPPSIPVPEWSWKREIWSGYCLAMDLWGVLHCLQCFSGILISSPSEEYDSFSSEQKPVAKILGKQGCEHASMHGHVCLCV